ncbi:hypothetical protein [Streptomyces tanashiensis]|uniref:SH3b domain-containing protein n=1 Tax=Streptomyces tanashiensis TaxID=67367 RepID=A0ABY6RAY3_9ACTN|nr:hypothetical protein [Streptomyces tanashiensis]UZX26339.1 hypothetical protein LDH80_39445 [Streptomyces tanashiensis]
MRKLLTYLLPFLALAGVVAGLTAVYRSPAASAEDADARKYWVTTFQDGPGRRAATKDSPRVGTLRAGTNYVWCVVKGGLVNDARGSHNSYWMWADLDEGDRRGWVSAYYLKDFGNEEAKADDGTDLPTCGNTPAAPPAPQPSGGAADVPERQNGRCATPTVKKFYPGMSRRDHERLGEVDINISACPWDGTSSWEVTTDDVHVNSVGRAILLRLSTGTENHGKITAESRTFYVTIRAERCAGLNYVGDLCATVSEWEVHVHLKRSGNAVTAELGWDHPINKYMDGAGFSLSRMQLFESP